MSLHDRPAWTEVVAVLVVCALLLVGLAKLDGKAARKEAVRARAALAAQELAARPDPNRLQVPPDHAWTKVVTPGSPAVRTPAAATRIPTADDLRRTERSEALLGMMATVGLLLAGAGVVVSRRWV